LGVFREKVQSDVAKLYKLVKAQPQISRGNKAAIKVRLFLLPSLFFFSFFSISPR